MGLGYAVTAFSGYVSQKFTLYYTLNKNEGLYVYHYFDRLNSEKTVTM